MSAERTVATLCAALVLILTVLYAAFDFHFAFNNDALHFSHNKAQAFQAALRSGEVPMWNRLEAAGIDQLAEGSKDFIVAGLLYFVDAKTYLVLGGFLALAGSVFAFYWFVVTVGLRPWPAAVGAVVWASNGFSLWHLHELNQQTVILWLPVVLGAVASLSTQPVRARALLLLSAAAALSYGRLELVEFIYVIAGLFILLWVPHGRRIAAIGTVAGSLALGALLVAWFLLPYTQTLAQSARIGEVRSPAYLPWDALLRHLLPSTEARVASRAFIALGALPLCLFVPRRHRQLALLCAASTAVYLLLSYDTGAYRVVQALPLHGANWNVERFALLFFFGAALLAACGLDRLEPGEPPPSRALVRGATVLTAITVVSLVFVLFRLPDLPRPVLLLNFAQTAAAGVTVAALIVASVKGWRSVNRLALSAVALGAMVFGTAFNWLDLNDGDLRLLERTHFGRLRGDIESPGPGLRKLANGQPFRVYSETILHPAYWAAQGIESLGYYSPFVEQRQAHYVGALASGASLEVPPGHTGESALARIADTGYLCTYRTTLPGSWRRVYDAHGLRCYQRPDPLSRVRLVSSIRSLSPTEDPIATLIETARQDPSWFDHGIIVEGRVASPPSLTGSPGRAAITRRTTNTLDIVVDANGEVLLTIAERFAEGWHVTLDGKKVQLLRANALFQALPVPAGRHEVRLRYRTPLLPAGMAVAILALPICVAWVRAGRRRGPDRQTGL